MGMYILAALMIGSWTAAIGLIAYKAFQHWRSGGFSYYSDRKALSNYLGQEVSEDQYNDPDFRFGVSELMAWEVDHDYDGDGFIDFD